MNIEDLIFELSRKPFNPELNFETAVKYEELHQTASAVSFYLRTVEYGYDTAASLVYASLCKLAHCFEDQKDRAWTVSNCLLQAIAYLPYRPEAYFLLSRFYERTQQWQESYTWAEVGLHQPAIPALPIDVGYQGQSSLEFQKAVAAYWVGRPQESKNMFVRLSQLELPEEYKKAIADNLGRLNAVL